MFFYFVCLHFKLLIQICWRDHNYYIENNFVTITNELTKKLYQKNKTKHKNYTGETEHFLEHKKRFLIIILE